MSHERDANERSSRRRMLAALGAASTTLAGCMDILSDDDGNGVGRGEMASGPTHWPAIETGQVVSDFEDLDEWSARTGKLSAASDEARLGSQAAVVESDEATAGMEIRFDDGIDFEDWDTSLAVKPESADRIIVEFLAPTRSERLTSIRIVPDGYDGWFRMDCGYQQKPGKTRTYRTSLASILSRTGRTADRPNCWSTTFAEPNRPPTVPQSSHSTAATVRITTSRPRCSRARLDRGGSGQPRANRSCRSDGAHRITRPPRPRLGRLFAPHRCRRPCRNSPRTSSDRSSKLLETRSQTRASRTDRVTCSFPRTEWMQRPTTSRERSTSRRSCTTPERRACCRPRCT